MKLTDVLDQYADICRDAIMSSKTKVQRRIVNIIIEILTLYMVIPRKINFTQMERYGSHGEQTFRNNFELYSSKGVDWLNINSCLAKRYFGEAGGRAIAVDPSYIPKSGKMTPHIGRFWSGCAGATKHGLEIMGIGLVSTEVNDCIMLRADQSPSTKELKLRDKALVDHYIDVIGKHSSDLQELSKTIVADAFFSTSTFADGIKKHGFSLVSRLRDNACLYYLYDKPRAKKRGRPKLKDGKINTGSLDYSRMEKLEIDGLKGEAYTLLAYSKALKCKIRLVIWDMPDGKKKLFFSNDITMSGEAVLRTYRSRFQCEFCYRDAKQFAGLADCQARSENKLDFAFNASFTSVNVAKVMMKEMKMDYSMSSFKLLMSNTYLAKRIFKACGYRPNRTFINRTFKDLFGLQRKAV